MTRVLATLQHQGRRGQDLAAVNLAYLASRDGYRTLLWDLDPQAAAPTCSASGRKVRGGGRAAAAAALARSPELIKGTDLRAARSAARRLLLPPSRPRARRVQEADTSGSRACSRRCAATTTTSSSTARRSISLVSESVFEAADALLVPVIPATLSSRTYEQLEELAAGGPARARVLLDVRGAQGPASRRRWRACASIHHLTMLGAAIPPSDEVERMGEERNPVAVFAPGSLAALAYQALWLDIQRRIGADRRVDAVRWRMPTVSEHAASPAPAQYPCRMPNDSGEVRPPPIRPIRPRSTASCCSTAAGSTRA